MGLGSFLGDGDEGFDGYDEFVPDHLPEPGAFLDGHTVLAGEAHTAFHDTARELFEERGVYDMTFGYNLARLNLDGRHPTAGFRYAEETENGSGDSIDGIEGSVLRAEFTPTTEFCPQSDTLTVGAFRAFNGERDAHGYDLVRVRVDGMHQEAVSINGKLRQLERSFAETGEVGGETEDEAGTEPRGEEASATGTGSGADGSRTPF
jgi:hypothetical protein